MTMAQTAEQQQQQALWAITVPRTPDECRKSAHFEQYSSRYDTADDKKAPSMRTTDTTMISTTPTNRRGKTDAVALRAVRVPRMPNECRNGKLQAISSRHDTDTQNKP